LEEEFWLLDQVKLVNDAIRSVSVGDEIFQELYLYNMGEPLPKDHLPKVLRYEDDSLHKKTQVCNILFQQVF
jgi:hypothetical protein